MTNAREIIDRIAENREGDDTGRLANDLVSAISRGGAVEDLRRLFSSTDDALIDIGIWVASELGSGAAPLVGDIVPLLEHSTKAVRYHAIGSLLACNGAATGRDMAAILGRLDDVESAVRWKAIDFLARAPSESLQRMRAHVEAAAPASSDARGLRWLVNEGAGDSGAIISAFQDPDTRFRRYAAAAAARIFDRDRAPLTQAAGVDDPGVSAFATSCLKLNADIEDARRRRRA